MSQLKHLYKPQDPFAWARRNVGRHTTVWSVKIPALSGTQEIYGYLPADLKPNLSKWIGSALLSPNFNLVSNVQREFKRLYQYDFPEGLQIHVAKVEHSGAVVGSTPLHSDGR